MEVQMQSSGATLQYAHQNAMEALGKNDQK